jgi:hypothetical protein
MHLKYSKCSKLPLSRAQLHPAAAASTAQGFLNCQLAEGPEAASSSPPVAIKGNLHRSSIFPLRCLDGQAFTLSVEVKAALHN